MSTWVSVEDALPEREVGFVLVLQVWPHELWVKPAMEVGYFDSLVNRWMSRYAALSGQVTHWMLLPELPQG